MSICWETDRDPDTDVDVELTEPPTEKPPIPKPPLTEAVVVRARVLLDKLVRFEAVKRRHDSLRNGPTGAAAATPAVATIAIPGPRDPRYDGVGKLLPVVTQKTGGPQYALFDPTGAVLSFVTPAPGVNLRPYVDKNVGVNGQRGYLPELQRQHVSVQRVTLLDVQRR